MLLVDEVVETVGLVDEEKLLWLDNRVRNLRLWLLKRDKSMDLQEVLLVEGVVEVLLPVDEELIVAKNISSQLTVSGDVAQSYMNLQVVLVVEGVEVSSFSLLWL